MKRIAIFGGTFDPIHWGHINLALEFDKRLHFDKILLIPTRIPPHKDDIPAPAEHRLNMCRLAAEQYLRFEVSDMELRRAGKSFTVDTARALHEQYPGDKVYLIVGSDMYMTLESWHNAHTLFGLVTACAAAREEGQYEMLLKKQRQLKAMGAESVVLGVAALPISSTMIRRLVREHLPLDGRVPDHIERYIRENGLYLNGPCDGPALPVP